MKKLLMIAASVCLMATAAFAQTGTTTKAPAGAKTAATKTQYECPKCNAMSDKPGKCAKCNVAMVKVGDYYCPGCYATSSKPGHCAHCNMDMKQMTATASK
jgi:hypothetical protein